MNKFNLCDYMSDDEYEKCIKELGEYLIDLNEIEQQQEFPKYWEAYDPYGEGK